MSHKKYQFSAFYHVYADELLQQFNRFGVDGVLKPKADNDDGGEILFRQKGFPSDRQFDFDTEYGPHSINVMGDLPKEDFDFTANGAYSNYNWEIFYHVPILTAERLSQNQKFEDAQRWFHYIFDPTISFDASLHPELDDTNLSTEDRLALENRLKASRFWRLKPFHELLNKKSIDRLLTDLSSNSTDPKVVNLNNSIDAWQDNPFQPHLLAQMRVISYMKYTVMKYLDNLIAWGDSLFRQDTLESINEATQIYLLAANILGERPTAVDRKNAANSSYDDLAAEGGFDAFSNKLVQLENGINGIPANRNSTATASNNALSSINLLFFCIPSNTKMEGYWDTVADRLFKIRNCQSIDGVERQLALFAPAIDPLALVKAAGRGGSYLEAIRNLNAPLPAYRFQYMIQRALELCGEVKNLGGALLSALEKKDAEVIAGVRSLHELNVLDNLRHSRKLAIDEANQTIETLVQSKDNVNNRFNYYSSRQFMNKEEQKQLQKLSAAMNIETGLDTLETLRSTLLSIPTFTAGANGALGSPHFATKFGGHTLTASLQGTMGVMRLLAARERNKATNLSIKAGHKRRKEDWDFQAQTAKIELAQIDKQIEGAYLRKDIALYELELNQKQAENAQEIAQVMESKFTNKELYSWMITQLSDLYFRSYQLALDVAKVAEKCYQFERFDETASFIQSDNWDSLKKGLLAGERLNNNLRQMQQAYDTNNKRRLEITKNISIKMLDADAIIQLRQTGTCNFHIPEILFDLDFPGHYKRRIKSVSISMPCILGPNGNLPAKLSLGNNFVRKDSTGLDNYGRTADDIRFVTGRAASRAIATSTANRDSGLFELNFNDSRYLPFEGAGVISDWSLSLPNPEIAQFDYESISDVVLHISYEAEEAGISAQVTEYVKGNLNELAVDGKDWSNLISLKQQFSSQIISLFDGNATDFPITSQYYPFFFRDKSIDVKSIDVILVPKEGQNLTIGSAVDLNLSDGTNTKDLVFSIDPDTNLPTASASGATEGASLNLNLETLSIQKATGADTDLTNDLIEDVIINIHFEATTVA